MRILVTGANGQLGMSLKAAAPAYPAHEFLFTDLAELDITDTRKAEKAINKMKPDMLVNCASYNAVDQAEDDASQAIRINATAVEGLARLARKYAMGMVHISTDYVFDGTKGSAYTELDEPGPQSVYARSKLLGEQAVLDAAPHAAIIRTSWLHSEYGHNFVKTIRRLAAERSMLRVVNDQSGSPTYAGDLAGAIMHIIPHVKDFGGARIYHYANEGITHWAGFAEAIIALSRLDCTVEAVTTAEYGLAKAARPAASLLDKTRIKTDFGLVIPEWHESLKKCIHNLEKEEQL